MLARDFKGSDKGRDDFFAETPPLEAIRWILSRAAKRRKEERFGKVLFVDAKKAYLNQTCDEDVYIKSPEECGCPESIVKSAR